MDLNGYAKWTHGTGTRSRAAGRLLTICRIRHTLSLDELAGKPLIWLYGEVKTPPFSREGRLEAGFLLRRLQKGEKLGMPQSRPMPSIGPQCHELRITDAQATWRVIYRTDRDAIVIAGLFKKKAQQTPKNEMNAARKRLRRYDDA